jgi:hypothetical protein
MGASRAGRYGRSCTTLNRLLLTAIGPPPCRAQGPSPRRVLERHALAPVRCAAGRLVPPGPLFPADFGAALDPHVSDGPERPRSS